MLYYLISAQQLKIRLVIIHFINPKWPTINGNKYREADTTEIEQQPPQIHLHLVLWATIAIQNKFLLDNQKR